MIILKKINKKLLCYALFLVSFPLSATPVSLTLSCFQASSQKYSINANLLKAIAIQESSLNPNAVNARSANDEDLGLMQINSFWFESLQSHGITRAQLFEPCVSIDVGAWVLAQSIHIFGDNWHAVGAYNAGTAISLTAQKKRANYAKSVYRHFIALHDGLRPSNSNHEKTR